MISLRPHQLRGVDAMSKHNKGQLIKPTGAGKTLTMIADALKEFAKETPQTIVVVCPRILLAEQLSSEFLEFIVNAEVLHVHSGETHHESTTNQGIGAQMWQKMNLTPPIPTPSQKLTPL